MKDNSLSTKDILTSVKAYLYDKATSPLVGALLTSAVFWNFKMLMLIFSKEKHADKVTQMDKFYSQPYFSSENLTWLTNDYMLILILPVCTAAFYLFVFPSISHKVFAFTYKKQIELNNMKKTLQESELITKEEKLELLKTINDLELAAKETLVIHREETLKLDSQIETLILEKSELEKQVEQLNKSATLAMKQETAEKRSDDGKNAETFDPAFYINASDKERSTYHSILSQLFLETRTASGFSGYTSTTIEEAMPVLIIEGLVVAVNHSSHSSNKYELTNEGRSFYRRMKRGEFSVAA